MLQGALLLIAVLYFASDLLIPLALSVLLSFVLAPVMRAFRRVGLPRVAACCWQSCWASPWCSAPALLVARQASSLAENLPGYQAAISTKLSGLQASGGLVDRLTGTLQRVGQSLRPEAHPQAEGPPGDMPAARAGGGTRTAAAAPAENQPVPVVIRTPAPTRWRRCSAWRSRWCIRWPRAGSC